MKSQFFWAALLVFGPSSFAHEAVQTDLFNNQVDEVGKYAREPLDKANLAEVVMFARQVLRNSESQKSNWNFGNAVHYSHLAIGRVRLKQSDVPGAIEALKNAGSTPGSPQLKTFGPNMVLAKELLEKGEKTAVLDYLKQLEKFWTDSSTPETLNQWRTQIKAGKIPDFGANLKY